MSEPKRYKHTFLYGTDGFVNESFLIDEKYNTADEGEYVSYEDYNRLKAENERLISVSEAWKKRRLDKVEAECIDWSDYEKLKAANARLKAEVARLRKADGWQPMETAPFDPNIRIIICTFDDEVEITYSSDLCHYSEREYPRYWMPAPKPPKEGKPSV